MHPRIDSMVAAARELLAAAYMIGEDELAWALASLRDFRAALIRCVEITDDAEAVIVARLHEERQ